MLHFRLDHRFDCRCGREHNTFIRKLIVEPGAKDRVIDCIEELGIKGKGLIVGDGNTRRIAGEYIERILKKKGYETYNILAETPDEENVNKVIEKILRYKIGFAVAVGGTSVIDVVKSAAFTAGSRMKNSIPYIAFTTTAANDGLASITASIYEYRNGKRVKVSRVNNPPIAVMADLDIISDTLKNENTKWMIPAGFGEITGKITSLKDWELGRDEKGEYYCEYIAKLVCSSLDDELDFVEEIAKGSERGLREHVHSLINMGMAMILANSSRPCSGSEHLFCHALDSINEANRMNPGRHGEQVAVGTILMAAYYMALNMENWWREKKYQPEYIHRYLNKLKCPSTIKDIDMNEDTAVEALIEASSIRPERYTILHKCPLTMREAQTLLNV